MVRVFRQYISLRKAAFVVGEGALIFCAATLASYLQMREETYLRFMIQDNWLKILLISVVAQLSFYFNDLYETWIGGNGIDLAMRLIQAIGITSIVLAVIYFLWPAAMIGRYIFFLSLIFLILFFLFWRLLYSYVVYKGVFSEKALILGDGELSEDLLKEINRRGDISYDIRYVVSPENRRHSQGFLKGTPVKYGFETLCDLAEREGISSIIVALDQKRGVMPYNELLDCKVRGINIIDGESFYERIAKKLLVEKINPSWLIFSDGFKRSAIARLLKRVVGLALSITMFVPLSPLIAVVAAAIKLDSKGPVFFQQERVGENGEIYTIFKFRSMRQDAEAKSGPVWAGTDDPRITRVGRIIRKLRMDELPQLWNVIKGDMSFVGPRPERPFFVDSLKKKVPYYNERFAVKPGITGWAQVMYPYGATEEDALEKLKYDLYYIKNMSFAMDMMVIFHTVKIVLLGRGSR